MKTHFTTDNFNSSMNNNSHSSLNIIHQGIQQCIQAICIIKFLHSPKPQLCPTIKDKVREMEILPLVALFCIFQFEKVCFLITSIFSSSSMSQKIQQKLQNKISNKIKTRTSSTKLNKIDLTIKFKIQLGFPPKKLLSLTSLARYLLQNVFISAQLYLLFKNWI